MQEFTRRSSSCSDDGGGDSVFFRKVFLLLLFSILSASTTTWAWVTIPTATTRRHHHAGPIVVAASGSNSNAAAEKNEDSAKDAAEESLLWKTTDDDMKKSSFPSSILFSRDDVETAFREEAERVGYHDLANRTNRPQQQALISKIDRNMRVAQVQSSMNQLLSSLSSSSYLNDDFLLHNQTTTQQRTKNILPTKRVSQRRQKKMPMATPIQSSSQPQLRPSHPVADFYDLDAHHDDISTAENTRKVNILRKLEATLQQSVRSHDFETAQECKRQLDDLQFQDHISLMAVNAQFYRAFSTQDLRAMENVWLAHSPNTCLIHPSHPPIYGAKKISESWKRLLGEEDDAPNASTLRSCWIEPAHTQVSVLDGATMGIVVCEERVYARTFVRGHRRKTELVNTLTATNVFRKINNSASSSSWKLVHHHSSSLPSVNNTSSIATGNQQKKNDQNKNEKPPTESILDAIMGYRNVGPVVNAPPPPPLPVKKRLVVRDIAELFAIDDDDDDEEVDDDDTEDELRNELFSPKGKSKKNRRRRTDLENRNRVEDDEDDDGDIETIDEDEDDYYDEEDDDDDDDGKFPYHQDSNLRGGMKKQWREAEFNTDQASNVKKKRTEQRKKGGGNSLVITLRKLGNSGMISLRQKRALLTDLITSSARGQVPMVQVAYDLLLSDEAVDDDHLAAAEEEFAEQCRIFADNLLHSEEDASPQITRSVYE
jgi:hypothetical protein